MVWWAKACMQWVGTSWDKRTDEDRPSRDLSQRLMVYRNQWGRGSLLVHSFRELAGWKLLLQGKVPPKTFTRPVTKSLRESIRESPQQNLQ